ncbi:ABC transporter substrate-binding protein [Saccharolobus islandicus]|uniref:Extracellular solute-binding protein, family 5 n=1 Tax=Saccharolobus islandicus (strain L.D.8.5 / Lassen \|nr:ABC transporter substrate-binding protein [Sulfolobus islandicus]ADB88610.1 extracellular solute-binding protein, family 5 [Sulfolobus islandicus L.D.8.5]
MSSLKGLAFLLVILTSMIIPSLFFLQTSAQTSLTISPSNSSILVDVSQVAPPDALDPATGFYVQDGPLYQAIFQELVEYNGSNYLQVVPVIAQNWSTTNYENWTFYIRHGVYFPDGVQVNASTVWFSFYRIILMGQGPGVANYIGLLFNSTQYGQTGYALPWGVAAAIQNVTGLPTTKNATLAAKVLASILSHFNAANTTIQKIMEYPYQAVVVEGPYKVKISTLEPYRYFLLDIASWWGAIVNPVFIDEHGGVQPNTPNSYINDNGMEGTGPYVIKSVGPSLSEIVLVKNPNYWANNLSNIPVVAQPGHIPVIDIKYGLSHNARVEDFATNQAQISYVSLPFLQQIYSAYQYNKYVSFNQIFVNLGYEAAVFYIAMNTQIFPTNITAFRQAIVHAINYTAELDIFKFQNQTLAIEYLGPISPVFPLYNEVMQLDKLHPYTYNLSLALHYLNEAGYEGHFYVVLPNGTTIGDTNGKQLGTLTIYALAPVNELEQEQLTIVQDSLQKIGISTSIQYVLPSVTDNWITPNGTPALIDLGWFPDWPDPIFQELMAQTDVLYGGISGDLAWVNISTLQQIYENLPFLTNQTQQTLEVAKVYQILYQEAPYAWLPNPVVYYFVQPYVKGFVYNPFIGYYYNLMYYQPYTVTISTSTSITSSTTTTSSLTTTTTTTSTVTTTTTSSLTTTTTTSSSPSTLIYATIGIVVVIVIIVVAIVLLRGRGRGGGPGF